jgi:hypothetical protein
LYNAVLIHLEEELTANTIESNEKNRIQHVLEAYAEMLTNIPEVYFE